MILASSLKMFSKTLISKGIIHLHQLRTILLILPLRNLEAIVVVSGPQKKMYFLEFFVFSKQNLMSFKKKSID